MTELCCSKPSCSSYRMQWLWSISEGPSWIADMFCIGCGTQGTPNCYRNIALEQRLKSAMRLDCTNPHCRVNRAWTAFAGPGYEDNKKPHYVL